MVASGPPISVAPPVPTPIRPGGGGGPLARVLPLGDSITFGTGTPGGYRLPLAGLLAAANQPVDFVGTLKGNNPPTFFDPEHQGHVAWTVDDLIQYDGNGVEPDSSIEQILEATQPETILLHIGTNDMLLFENWQTGAERLDELLDRIWSVDPEVRVLVATIVPTGDAPTNLTVDYFNSEVREYLWERWNDGFPVRLVDMAADLTDFELIDGVHPSASGYQAMAGEWLAGLLSPEEPVPAPPVQMPGVKPIVAVASDFNAGFTPALAVNGTGLLGDLHQAQLGDVPLGWRSEPFTQLVGSDGIGVPAAGSGPQFVLRLPGAVDLRKLRIWNGRVQSFDGVSYLNGESVRRVRVETSSQLPLWQERGELVLTKGPGRFLAPYEELEVDWDDVKALRLTVLETYGNFVSEQGTIFNSVALSEVRLFGLMGELQVVGSSH